MANKRRYKVKPKIAVIIVSYNCPEHIKRNMDSLRRQTRKPNQIIIVDNKSEDSTYLESFNEDAEIIYNNLNIGFCAANNEGLSKIDDQTNYVLFLNPDAFLTEQFIEKALDFMEDPENASCGAMTGILLGFDPNKEKPTGLYDSTGIFSTPYGKWFDRDQGQKINPNLYITKEEVPAICGALMLCRKKALMNAALKDQTVWDNTFFMYKDDIDLSLRLRKKGWKLMFVPDLVAYHCRGWAQNRSEMSKEARLGSAKNELRMHLRSKEYQFLPYSLIKYAAVKFFNR